LSPPDAELLEAYNAQCRAHAHEPRPGNVESTRDGPLLRTTGFGGQGWVEYHDLGGLEGDALDELIQRQIAFFRDRGEQFEWKYHGHDLPDDLPDRLRGAGFEPEDRETIVIARVVDTKCFPGGRKFAVLDAGMAELMRPALYGSFHRIVPVVPRTGSDTAWDVVGPICESSDVFARERLLPPLEVDDLVAILDAGAYGSVMGSNYNRHLLPAEVLVDEGKWSVIRRRQTLDDVLALEG